MPDEVIENNGNADASATNASELRTETPADADDGYSARDRLRARQRLNWRESAEHARFSRALFFVISINVILIIVAVVVATAKWRSTSNDPLNENYNHNFHLGLGLAVGVGIVLYITSYAVLLYRLSLRRAVRDKLALGIARKLDAEESEIATGGTTPEFGSLWAATQKRISFYHEIATDQARRSFLSSQIAASAGFLVVVLVAIFAAFSRKGTGAIAAGVIGTAGAGLSAYVGATFAKAQASASAQLRAFFLQPVDFSRALGAERLLDKVPENERAKIVEHIVQSMTPIVEVKAEGK